MFALAAPVVVAELGWITMGMVDTLMVGRLSPEAIGAVGIGSSLFFAVAVFAMGLLLGLDTLVSQAFGADNIEDCHRWLVHGVVLAVALAVDHRQPHDRPRHPPASPSDPVSASLRGPRSRARPGSAQPSRRRSGRS